MSVYVMKDPLSGEEHFRPTVLQFCVIKHQRLNGWSDLHEIRYEISLETVAEKE